MKKDSMAKQITPYVLSFLADGKVRTIKEIEHYIKETTKIEFTYGALTGVLRRLVETDSDYIREKNGAYKFIGGSKVDFRSIANKVLDDAVTRLIEAATINILDVSAEDLEAAKEVKKLIREIEKLKL